MNDEIYAQVLGRMLKNWRIANGLNIFKVSQETNNRLESIRNVESGLGKLSTLAAYCRFVAQTDKFHYHSMMDEWGEKMTKLEGITQRAAQAIAVWNRNAGKVGHITDDLRSKLCLYLDWMELSDDKLKLQTSDLPRKELENLQKSQRGSNSALNDFSSEELVHERYRSLLSLVKLIRPKFEISEQLSRVLFTLSLEPQLNAIATNEEKWAPTEKEAVEEIHWNVRHPENRKWEAIMEFHKQCKAERKNIEDVLMNLRLIKKCGAMKLLNEEELYREYHAIEEKIATN